MKTKILKNETNNRPSKGGRYKEEDVDCSVQIHPESKFGTGLDEKKF